MWPKYLRCEVLSSYFEFTIFPLFVSFWAYQWTRNLNLMSNMHSTLQMILIHFPLLPEVFKLESSNIGTFDLFS